MEEAIDKEKKQSHFEETALERSLELNRIKYSQSGYNSRSSAGGKGSTLLNFFVLRALRVWCKAR